MEAIASHASGRMSKEKFDAIEANALPGPGTCSAMFTANTMSSAVEALGLSPPHTSSRAATDRVAAGAPEAANPLGDFPTGRRVVSE